MASAVGPDGKSEADPSATSRVRESITGGLLTASAFLFGLVSLTYPFGRDQGLYFYVAREWVKRGSIPYRDVLDHKTPGIYMLHALSIVLFGENAWGIRLIELFGVAVCGGLAAAIASPSDQALRRDVLGAGALAMSLLYFGSFDFWDTAQSEIWYTFFGFAAVVSSLRFSSIARASVWAGLASGVAIIMKPPAIWFALVAAGVVAARVRRSNERTLLHWLHTALRFAAGAIAVPAVVLGYFALHGSLSSLIDVVVGANSYYVRHEAGAASVRDEFWNGVRHFAPLSVVLPMGGVVGVAVGRRERHWPTAQASVIGLALLAAGFAATAMQGKFYLLHHGSMIGPMCVLAITAIVNSERWLGGRFAGRTVASFLFALFATSWWTGGGLAVWYSDLTMAWAHHQGRASDADYAKSFSRPRHAFWYDQSVQVATWLAAHTTAEDTVTVRGFEPQIYALSQRRHAGRFFWSTFLVSPERAYRREEWIAEDERDFLAHPPKYIVSLDWVPAGVDSKAWAEQRGYVKVALMGGAAIMERRH